MYASITVWPTLLVCCLASLLPSGAAQSSTGSDPLAIPARDWALDAARNELPVVEYKSGFVRYRTRVINGKGDQTRDLIETPDGPVARLLMRDGRPISPDQDAAERSRLQALLEDSASFHKHIHEDENGKHTAADLIRLLPDAMVYSYAPGQPQRPGHIGTEVVLDYKPNPSWTPPTTISGALTGLEGRLWIDAQTRRLTHLECRVFRSINIGFGVLAHVNPGGSFMVDQVQLADGRVIVTHFTEHVDLRALMVKSMHENEDMTALDFQPVASMSYADAIHLLLETPLPR